MPRLYLSVCTPYRQIDLKRLTASLIEIYHSLLGALSEHAQRAQLRVDVAEVDAGELGQTHSAVEKESYYCIVPLARLRIGIAAHRVEQCNALFEGEKTRQGFFVRRCFDICRRAFVDQMPRDRIVFKKRLYRRQSACDCPRLVVVVTLFMIQKGEYVVGRYRLDKCLIYLRNIVAVVFLRARRQPVPRCGDIAQKHAQIVPILVRRLLCAVADDRQI